MPLPAGFLDSLRGELKLSQIASRWVVWDTRKSNPAKGDYWAPCPFHKETNSSFHIDDRKGFFYCFGCHAKGDAISLVRELENVSFIDAVRRLAFIVGKDEELAASRHAYEAPTLLQIKDLIVENFTKENFLEVAIIIDRLVQVQNHPRLLRSLSWDDPDYPGNVLEFLVGVKKVDDDAIGKIEAYIAEKFPDAVGESIAFSAIPKSKGSLDYRFEKPRNDVVSVMMPFSGGFNPVYDVIKEACSETPHKAVKADQVWNHSVLIKDILELINHSAVVICDLTGRNENVFYKLGIAHAWGKPVIPITQSADDVPFDLRHHRYLTYLNNAEGREELKEALTKRLINLVGDALPF